MIDMTKINGDWSYNPTKNTNYLGSYSPQSVGDSVYDPYESWTPETDPNWAKQYGATQNATLDWKMRSPVDPAARNIMQNWWRNPDWKGETYYNPYFGWQDYNSIAANYRAAQGPVTWEQIMNWGMTPNMTFPGYGDSIAQYDGDQNQYSDFTAQVTPGQDTSNSILNGTNAPSETNIQYPTQWNTASDTLSGLARGDYYTAQPQAWSDAQGYLNQLMRADPVSYAPAYQAAKDAAAYDIRDAVNQAAEKAGLTQTRWSSTLGRTAQDEVGKIMAQLGSTYATQELQSQQDLRNQQIQGLSQMQTLGQSQAGLSTDTLNRALSAANSLSSLGGQYAQYPLDVSSAAMSAGNQINATQQKAIDALKEEWTKTLPENSPWLKLISAFSSTPGTPATYGQSGLTSLLGGAGSLLSCLA